MSRSPFPALGLVVALALGVAVAGPSGGAVAQTTSYTFYGGGWGHGVGLGQYGALGLAQQGWSYRAILKHYYTGTTIGRVSGPPGIRVGLLQNRSSIAVQAENGPVNLRVGTDTRVATIPAGEQWTIVFRSDGQIWVRRPDGTYVGGHGWGGPGTGLYAFFHPSGATVHLPATGNSYDQGSFEFETVACGAGCYRGLLVARVPTEAYVDGIAEVPNTWPAAALKAQAVAARSYAIYKAVNVGQHRPGCDCAVYASTRDQVYVGLAKTLAAGGADWRAAVAATAWQVVKYQKAVAETFYSASTGGHTESNSVVWGGQQLPYLREVCDPGDFTVDNPFRVWRVSMTADAVGAAVSAYWGVDIGPAASITVDQRSGAGRVQEVTVAGATRTITMSGAAFQSALGLRSTYVFVNTDLLVTGRIRREYDALGCAPGLAATPRQALAGGSEQSFADGTIYLDSTTGTARWVHGSTLAEYLSLKGPEGFLGFPTGPEVDRARGWSRQAFQKGRIYASAASGAHEINGLVLKRWLRLGGVGGRLGLPTSDVRTGVRTRSSTFQHGSIVCRTTTRRCKVTVS